MKKYLYIGLIQTILGVVNLTAALTGDFSWFSFAVGLMCFAFAVVYWYSYFSEKKEKKEKEIKYIKDMFYDNLNEFKSYQKTSENKTKEHRNEEE